MSWIIQLTEWLFGPMTQLQAVAAISAVIGFVLGYGLAIIICMLSGGGVAL